MSGETWLDMFLAGLVLGASIGGLCSAFGESPLAAMLFGASAGWAFASMWHVLTMPADLSSSAAEGVI